MRYLGLFFLVACSAQNEKAQVEDAEIAVDGDGDGFLADDCDDSNPLVNSGATEICDGIDNDCDGEVDEDVLTEFYGDSDGDGFGNPLLVAEGCEAPAGFVSNGTDCDDTRSDIYPSAEEVCDDLDNDCDEEIDEELAIDYFVDSDGDGFGDPLLVEQACDLRDGLSTIADDCDDSDPQVNPLADELCDDIDNNCDGVINEPGALGEIAAYVDSDGDGYGSATAINLCELTTGYAMNADDCNDDSADVFPGAAESCDGIDNDCDGTVDGSNAIDQQVWYADTDTDGYGDLGAVVVACDAPTNHVANALDCDDQSSSINPLAVEVCDNVDNNCDGDVDGDATNQTTWFLDHDSDGYGDSNFSLTQCEQPTGYVVDSTDCNDFSGVSYPGNTEVCDGVDNDCDGDADSDAVDQTTWYLDDDGDGYGDSAFSLIQCEQPTDYVVDGTDCDDTEVTSYPGALDAWYDGIDSDCSGGSDFDQDGDGWAIDDLTSADCDDTDPNVYPGALDVWYDGIDSDCSGGSDFDQDGDGYDSFIEAGGPDCDDTDVNLYLCGSDAGLPAPSCQTILDSDPNAPDGIYWIDPQMDGDPFEAYCDMTSHGGGWLLLFKDAPYYDDPSWGLPDGYETVHDDHHISPAYSQVTDFTSVMITYNDTIGDVSQCWPGMSFYDVIQSGGDCYPTQIDNYSQTSYLGINVSQSHNGCSGIRSRIGYNFHTWDGGISGTWMGIGRYGYKTNNTVFGTSCVFSERPWPSSHTASGDLYIR